MLGKFSYSNVREKLQFVSLLVYPLELLAYFVQLATSVVCETLSGSIQQHSKPANHKQQTNGSFYFASLLCFARMLVCFMRCVNATPG